MLGDVLLISDRHERAAREIAHRLASRDVEKLVVAVGGESKWLIISKRPTPLRSTTWRRLVRSAEIERYERYLAECRTETAARYFLRRIEELRGD